MPEGEMTARSEMERAVQAGRKFEKALKSASEICIEENWDVMGADLGEFKSRVAGICTNLEQHLAAGSVG